MKRPRPTRGILGGFVCLLWIGSAWALPGHSPEERARREILLRFVPGTTWQAYVDLEERYGLSIESVSVLTGVVRVRAADAESRDRAIARLANDERVEQTSRNARITAASPNDPLYPLQWNLHAVDAERAWRRVPDVRGTTVAVLDTGVAFESHRDGRLRFDVAPDLAGTPFVPGYDCVDGDSHPNDLHGHGTHIAGIISQTTDNRRGTAGLAIGAAILPLRVLDETGAGTELEVLDALAIAIANRAEVVNLSFVFGVDYVPSRMLEQGIAAAYEAGITIVAAAGNDGVDRVRYPAAMAGVIAVGAASLDDSGGIERADYSNYGADLDLLAPGGDLTKDNDRDGVPDGILAEAFPTGDPTAFAPFLLSGTSAAAAHVSATAAILRAAGANRDTVEMALRATARDLRAPGFDIESGAGFLDAKSALDAVVFRTVPTKPRVFARVDVTRHVIDCTSAATATVSLHDARGSPIAFANVYGHWTGSVSGSVPMITSTRGVSSTTSRRVTRPPTKHGCYQRGISFGFVVDTIELADGRTVHPEGHLRRGWYVVTFEAANRLGIRGVGLATNPIGLDHAPARPHGSRHLSVELLEPFAIVTGVGGGGGRRDTRGVTGLVVNPYDQFYRFVRGDPALADAIAAVLGVDPAPHSDPSFVSFRRELAILQKPSGDRLDRVLGVDPAPHIVADLNAIRRILGDTSRLHLDKPTRVAYVGLQPL